eukprot:TRINITY_DN4350_c0_g1_i1.p1 TRINITY_DN4350_c0_g1~~TRINITY_DN4350_c0_g1_i1.p1  ORF type:complete len:352 (-),score=12.99 TRINITY_DN4350_c0_g1_i1:127-1182(-)
MLVGLILVWFGQPPPWTHLMLETVRWNPSLRLLLFSDQHSSTWSRERLPPNVQRKFLNSTGFTRLALQTVGIHADVAGPSGGYKLCDWRMAYGEIFATWLRHYDFWGWIDLDVFLGRLGHFGFNASTLQEYDAVGEHSWPIQGPLTVLRNSPAVNRLWRTVPGVEERLARPTISRLNEWAFAQALQNADSLRRRPIGFPMHLSAQERHGPDDLIWFAGRVLHIPTCGEAAYMHFSGWKVAVARSAPHMSASRSHLSDQVGIDGPAWVISAEGVSEPDASTLERLRACLARPGGTRFAWDPHRGLTPEQAFPRRRRTKPVVQVLSEDLLGFLVAPEHKRVGDRQIRRIRLCD